MVCDTQSKHRGYYKKKKLLYLSHSDQSANLLATFPNLYLQATYDREINWFESLTMIFGKVEKLEYLKILTEEGTKILQKTIIEKVKEFKPDFVLIPMAMYEIHESTLSQIRKQGIKVILNFADDVVRFDNYSKWWIPYFDFCFTEDPSAVDKYTKLGAKSLHMICGANELVHKKGEGEKEFCVSFVGSPIANRNEYINELNNYGITVECFGKNYNRPLDLDGIVDVFNKTKINLNFSSSYAENAIQQIKARVFEITMTGSFLLTEYAPGIEKLFQIDKEIVCFSNKEELIEKVKYYLIHEDEREDIAYAGWQRALREHRWLNRLYGAFDVIHEEEHKKNYLLLNHRKGKIINKNASVYHYNWFLALKMAGLYQRAIDEACMSIKYNPFHLKLYWNIFKQISIPSRPKYAKQK